MSCRDIQSDFHDYIDQALADSKRLQIEAHLEECTRCRRELSDIKSSLALTQNLEEVDPPPFFTARIMAEVRTSSHAKSWLKRILLRPIRISAGTLAAIAILVVSLQLYTMWILGKPTTRPSMISDNMVPQLPDDFSSQGQPPDPGEILANHSLPDTMAQRLPDLQLTMGVQAIDPAAEAVLRHLLDMGGRILSIVAHGGEYRIMADIETEDKQELIQFLERIGHNEQVTGGLSSQTSTLVSIVLLRQPVNS